MNGIQAQAGSPNTDFLKGLDLIIDSLMEKGGDHVECACSEEGISKEQVVGTKTDDLEEDHTPF